MTIDFPDDPPGVIMRAMDTNDYALEAIVLDRLDRARATAARRRLLRRAEIALERR